MWPYKVVSAAAAVPSPARDLTRGGKHGLGQQIVEKLTNPARDNRRNICEIRFKRVHRLDLGRERLHRGLIIPSPTHICNVFEKRSIIVGRVLKWCVSCV